MIRDTQTGETLPFSFTKQEAAQAKAASLNAPTPAAGIAVPMDAALTGALSYVTKAKANSVGDTVGDVVRRAARSDPATVTPEFLASEPNVRPQLDAALATAKVAATDETRTALAQRLLQQEAARPTVGNRNAAAVREALGAPKPTAAAVDAAFADTTSTPGAGYPGGRPPAPPSGGGGAMPPDAPLPFGPTRGGAGDFARNLAAEIWALPRALKAGLDLSAVLLQGAPLITKDITKLPFYAYTKLRGGSQRPYFASALGQMFRATVSGESRVQQITSGFRDSLAAEGFTGKNTPHIADPSAAFGNLTAREEYMVGDLTTKIPVIGLGYRQGNYAYATLLNGLRTGEALNLARAAREVGIPVNHAKITHFVDIATGRGDLPFANEAVSKQVANTMSNVFFGPRLMTSAWQNAVDNIAAVGNIGAKALTRKALDPTDIARIQTTAAFVAAGWGAMKIAESSGLPIGTDPTKTDFGRITLPDGSRLDLWGPFNENARLVAREIDYVQKTLNGEAPKYGQNTGLDELVSYFRNKLNPPVAAAADLITGKTAGGIPTREAYTSLDIEKNPAIPAPFSVGTAIQGIKTGGGLGAAEIALGTLGASVLPPKTNVPHDALGRPETDLAFGKDAIMEEFDKLRAQDPNFAKEPLGPPDTTIGTGRNSFALPSTEADKYITAIGDQRRVLLGNLIYSQEYQNASQAERQTMFKDTLSRANDLGERQYLSHAVIEATDPQAIRAEAVAGLHTQNSEKEKAYWVALLDRAGKLTSDVKQAIDESNVARKGERAPTTVDEYLRAAPIIHEYLRHVPYGTDTTPIGTPQDWAAVEEARKTESVRKDGLIRSGTNPQIAELRAKAEALQSLRNLVQRSLFTNGPSLVNPRRTLLSVQYGSLLDHFLGSARSRLPNESETAYTNFPN